MQKYRSDIDGMRAIAVSTVVLGHAHVPGFGAGFLGVDIFFVISGFLITNILLKSDGTLGQDILKFYDRRVRRIAPALVLVLLACTVAAFVLFSPFELREFVRTLLAATGFVSNLYFMQDTDYFLPRYETPLLHLWSLGVEEQFYILYPLFLWVMTRYARRFLTPALIVLFLVSLTMSELTGEHHTREAFYFTLWRAWELTLGALVALHPLRRALPQWLVEGLAALALAAVIAPVFLFDLQTSWPGLHALIPCAGAAILLLLHEDRRSAVSRLLSLRLMVGIGLISYSLYLWHWPLFEFYHRWVLRTPTLAEYAALIATACLAAWLSWRFVERPFRRTRDGIGTRTIFIAAGVSALGLIAISGATLAAGGFPQRFAPDVMRAYATLDLPDTHAFMQAIGVDTCAVRSKGAHYAFDKCFVLSTTQPNVVLWGDSLARNLVAGLRVQTQKAGVNLIQATHSGCEPVLTKGVVPNSCLQFNKTVFDRLDEHISAVVLAGRVLDQEPMLNAMRDAAARTAAKGIRVIVIGPTPEALDPFPFYVARFTGTGNTQALDLAQSRMPEIEALDRRMAETFANMPGVTYVSFLQNVCKPGSCPLFVDGAPAEFDQRHFTIPASEAFAAKLWPQIGPAIAKQN